jgi:signal transduction histidine kinase
VFERQPGEARAALAAIQTVTSEALADMQRMLGALRQAGGAMAGDPAPGPAGRAAGPPVLAPAAAPLAPAPGLADLDRLVAGTAGAGVRVEVLRTGQARAIPAGIDLSAFRIVQEALTNVVKHSGADRCLVQIAYGTGQLCVEVTDPGQRPGPGPAGVARAPAGVAHAPAMADAPAGAVAVPGRTGARAGLAPGTGHGIAGMRERVSLCGGEFAAGLLPGQGFRVTARFPLPGAAR